MVRRVLAAGGLLALLAGPPFAQVRGWPPFFPRGRTVSYMQVGVDTTRAYPPPLYYSRTLDGDSLYLRGNISETKDLVQLYSFKGLPGLDHLEYYEVWIAGRYCDNSPANLRGGTTIENVRGNQPFYTYECGTIGGPHGLVVPTVTMAGHGKDSSDIGSSWTDGTYEFILAGIAGNVLTFYSVPYTDGGIWRMRTSIAAKLGYITGGTHTDSISVTSQSYTEAAPVTKNGSIRAYHNGVRLILPGKSDSCSFVDVIEEYDLVDPSSLDTTAMRSSRLWTWSNGETWVHVLNRFRLTAGSTVIHTIYAWEREMDVVYAYGTMLMCPVSVGQFDSTFYYVPRSKSVTGYHVPKAVHSAGGYAASIEREFNDTYIDDVSNPPHRGVYLFHKTGESSYDLGLATGFAPYLDAAPLTRAANVGPLNDFWYINSAAKTYDYIFGTYTTAGPNRQTGDSLDFYCYRTWFDPKTYNTRSKAVYWNDSHPDGSTLLFLDYFAAASNDVTILPARMIGKTIGIVDTLQMTVGSSTVSAAGISVSVNPGKTNGFAVLRIY